MNHFLLIILASSASAFSPHPAFTARSGGLISSTERFVDSSKLLEDVSNPTSVSDLWVSWLTPLQFL
jgi:hypothetical protein